MIYAIGVAFVLGYALKWLSGLEEIRYLRSELKVAHAQIAHAVINENAVMPARYVEPEPLKPLSAALQDTVNQWEGADTRAEIEADIRRAQAEGYSEAAIVKQFGGGA